jgi:hypothetical protein
MTPEQFTQLLNIFRNITGSLFVIEVCVVILVVQGFRRR